MGKPSAPLDKITQSGVYLIASHKRTPVESLLNRHSCLEGRDMVTVRIQAAVQSGRAILRLRNAMEQPVVVTRVLLAPPEAEEHAAVAPVEIKLNPGETQAVDITEPVLKIVKPLSMLDEQRKRLRIRLFLDPPPPDRPPVADCTLTVARGEIIEFHS